MNAYHQQEGPGGPTGPTANIATAVAAENIALPAMKELIKSGERDRMMETLKLKLIGAGWQKKVADYCKKVIDDAGVDNLSLDMLVDKVTPYARMNVPDEVKRDMVVLIQDHIENKLKLFEQFEEEED